MGYSRVALVIGSNTDVVAICNVCVLLGYTWVASYARSTGALLGYTWSEVAMHICPYAQWLHSLWLSLGCLIADCNADLVAVCGVFALLGYSWGDWIMGRL